MKLEDFAWSCWEFFLLFNKDAYFMASCNPDITGYTPLYIYMLAPPPEDLCFDIAVREIRQTQQKHARAILSVENNPVMVRHGQKLYLSRDG